jgi:hypothetical protein
LREIIILIALHYISLLVRTECRLCNQFK